MRSDKQNHLAWHSPLLPFRSLLGLQQSDYHRTRSLFDDSFDLDWDRILGLAPRVGPCDRLATRLLPRGRDHGLSRR